MWLVNLGSWWLFWYSLYSSNKHEEKINGVIQHRIVKNCGERLHCDSKSQGLLYATQCSDSHVGGQKHASIYGSNQICWVTCNSLIT